MITENLNFWNQKAQQADWQEYILPGRSEEEFEQEGSLQAMEFLPLLQNNPVVIDYGCGIGRLSRYMSLISEKVIGLDVSSEYIKRAKSRITIEKNLEFYTTDQFAYECNIADLIICIMVMQHNTSVYRRAIISHIIKLLKPGGMALISFPRQESRIYKETKFVHKFSYAEVEEFGKQFNSFSITEGNLVNYKNKDFKGAQHEYFLKAKK